MGDTVTVAFDPDDVHVFDRDTSDSMRADVDEGEERAVESVTQSV